MSQRVGISTQKGPPRWERLSARLSQRDGLSGAEVVIGGNGARWIRAGASFWARATWRRDGFHLARGLRRVLGWERRQGADGAARRGELEEMLSAVREADGAERMGKVPAGKPEWRAGARPTGAMAGKLPRKR